LGREKFLAELLSAIDEARQEPLPVGARFWKKLGQNLVL